MTYTYDTLGRVTSATYSDGTKIAYSYDAAGNRTQMIVGCSTCAPVANNVNATVSENSTNNPIPLNITGGVPTSVAVSTQATHGTATASTSAVSITYTPFTGYSGPDSFAYTASNSVGTSSPATANITVTPVSGSTWGSFTWGSATWQ